MHYDEIKKQQLSIASSPSKQDTNTPFLHAARRPEDTRPFSSRILTSPQSMLRWNKSQRSAVADGDQPRKDKGQLVVAVLVDQCRPAALEWC